MFNRFQLWLETDPQAKRKLLFWLLFVIVIGLVIAVFVYINNAGSNKTAILPQTQTSNPDQVTNQSFDQAKNLVKVDSDQVGLSNSVFFIPGGKIGFFNQSFKLRIDSQDIPNSPIFFPDEIYNSGDGILINSQTFSSIYQKNSQFKNFSSDVLQVTPILIPDDLGLDFTPGYVFLSKNQNQYTLKQAGTIDLTSNLKTLTSFSLDSGFTYPEIRILNSNIYIFSYQSPSLEGDVEIWKLTNNTLQKIQTLSQIKAISFGDRKFVYTVSSSKLPDATNYDSTIVDFTTNPNGDIKNLDITADLLKNNILGSLFAKRCTFGLNNDLYCLVKEQKVSSEASQYKDSLVRIDLSNNNLSFPVSGLVFSASSVNIANNGTIYIVGQTNNILYQIKG
jgi:hypothetical protein